MQGFCNAGAARIKSSFFKVMLHAAFLGMRIYIYMLIGL